MEAIFIVMKVHRQVTCTLSVLSASTADYFPWLSPVTVPLNLHQPINVLQLLSGEQTCRLDDVVKLIYLHGRGQVSWVRIEREGPIPMGHCTGEGCVVKSSLFLENQGNQVLRSMDHWLCPDGGRTEDRRKESPGGGGWESGS